MNGDGAVETVIGLEVHVQLRTTSKLFCGNSTEYGAPPNTHVCPVCLGLPGALPVLNAGAVELAVRTAVALGCEVHPVSRFARKSYVYPDLPKGYQITQHEHPLATGGALELPGEGGGRRGVRVRRVHLEEDTGKSLHDRFEGATALDFNRAGVPLVEIVTEPELRSPAEAHALLARLKRWLEFLRVSDCNLEEGSLRVDANVSLRGTGAGENARTEIKNLNSFSGVERALAAEIERQRAVVEAGGRVEPEVLLWDASAGAARPMRAKEDAADYRYFPEPDLPPLVVAPEAVERIRADLPETPWARAERLRSEHGLPAGHADALTATRELADYFEGAVRHGAPAAEAAGWVMGEVLAATHARRCGVDALPVRPDRLAALLRMLAAGEVSRPAARRVFARMLEDPAPPAAIVAAEGLGRTRDDAEVDGWVAETLRDHPAEAARLRAGETKLVSFFVGQVLRRSRGRADPSDVAERVRTAAAEPG